MMKIPWKSQALILNGALSFAIIVLIYAVLSSGYNSPAPLKISAPQELTTDTLHQTETTSNPRVTPPPDRPDPYPEFGKRDPFRTIIPRPTPTPTPAPTPVPDPPLARVIQTWRLVSVYGSEAELEDIKTQESFTMKVGDIRTLDYANQSVPVKLDKVNENDYEVTFTYKGQEQKKNMNF